MDTPDELLDAFAAAAETALREMAGVAAVRGDTFPAAAGDGLEDVSVALRLNGEAVRWVILCYPPATADTLARRILDGVGCEPDGGMIRDCAAEVLNVIAGQAKTLLFGTPHHFMLATPTPLATSSVDLAAERAVVRFHSDAGAFTLHVCPRIGATGSGPSCTGSEG